MTTGRFLSIALIFAGISVAWLALGGTIEHRTDELKESLSAEVNTMWGQPDLVQHTPYLRSKGNAPATSANRREPAGSDISVEIVHHNRYKGLLWFSTYDIAFKGLYEIETREGDNNPQFIFMLPSPGSFLGDLSVIVDDALLDTSDNINEDNILRVAVPGDGKKHNVRITYKTRGRDSWKYSSYAKGQKQTARLRNFEMNITTNFHDIDYPKGSVSPTTPAEASNGGMLASWKYGEVRSSQLMGIATPQRLNAGPIAARMSYFAPVSLFFFFTVLFTVVVLKKISLHPMHYLFVSAGFFAFHILLAYLVDIINLHAAFWTCAAVSVLLVVSYMRLVGGIKFSVLYVGMAQLIYLVGFSYAFFWEGKTGLTVTVGAIATLFVLMQATGKIDWSETFKNKYSARNFTPPPIPNDDARIEVTPEDPEASDE